MDAINFRNATGTNINISQLVATGSSTVSGLNFFNATGTNLNGTQIVFTGSSTISALNFFNATGTNLRVTQLVTTASSTVSGLNFFNATGTNLNGTQIVFTGSSTISALNFTNATGTNAVFSGVASSTNFQAGGLQFGNATGTNAFFSGVASSTNFQSGGLAFGNATGTNLLINGVLTVNTLTPTTALTIGSVAQNLVLQGSTTQIFATSTQPIQFFTGSQERVRIASSGFMGIGTSTPAYGLTIGDGSTQRDVLIAKGFLCVDSNNSGCAVASTTANQGTIYASTTAITAIDLAENYPTQDTSLEAGDIVAFDAANEENIIKATADNQNQIVGIISTAPGVLLGRKVENSRALALSGRVPVKITDEGGPIKVGDPIILSSSTPGVGIKGTNGRIVGYALQNWASGTGKINVFVKLQPAPTEPTVLEQIRASLEKLGVAIQDGILKVKTLIADLIQAKRVETDTVSANQLEMKDVDTGTIYCVQIKSGEWVKTPGACGSNPTAVQTVVSPPPPSSPPPPTDISTTTVSDATTTTTTDVTAADDTTSSDAQTP